MLTFYVCSEGVKKLYERVVYFRSSRSYGKAKNEPLCVPKLLRLAQLFCYANYLLWSHLSALQTGF